LSSDFDGCVQKVLSCAKEQCWNLLRLWLQVEIETDRIASAAERREFHAA
jgi:hypothetical protein